VKEKEEIGEYNYSRFLFRSAMGLSRAIAGCVDVCVYVYFGFVGLLFFCMTHLLIYIYIKLSGQQEQRERQIFSRKKKLIRFNGKVVRH
jgi:hypothetical protein